MRPIIPLPPTVLQVWNIAAYQLGWFAAVTGASLGHLTLALLVPLALMGLHLLLSPRPALELRLGLLFVLAGLVVDGAQGLAGLLDFSGATPYAAALAWLPPPWLLALWLLFASTLHHALRYLKRHLGLAALLGALAGPLAYLGGARLGAVALPEATPLTIAVLALTWGLTTPILSLLARRQDGQAA